MLFRSVVTNFLLASKANGKAINDIVHPAVFRDFEESGLHSLGSQGGAHSLSSSTPAGTDRKQEMGSELWTHLLPRASAFPCVKWHSASCPVNLLCRWL